MRSWDWDSWCFWKLWHLYQGMTAVTLWGRILPPNSYQQGATVISVSFHMLYIPRWPVSPWLPSLAQGNCSLWYCAQCLGPVLPAARVSGMSERRGAVLHVCQEGWRCGHLSCAVKVVGDLSWRLIYTVSISFFHSTMFKALLTIDVGPWCGDCARANILLR